MIETSHKTVLRDESIEIINVFAGGGYVDATFGEGGHSEHILELGGEVLGIDRDSEALEKYRREGRYRDHPMLKLQHADFLSWASQAPADHYDGIIADLGVSTQQLLGAGRGFSFQAEEPLDMRMDPSSGSPLRDLLLETPPEHLRKQFRKMVGWSPSPHIIRRAIALAEQGASSADLGKLVPRTGSKRHPATLFFLGLRMMVNQEFEQVETALPQFLRILRPKGRLAVISFHSSEDRLVKQGFRRLAGRCVCETEPCLCPRQALATIITQKPIAPSQNELRENPRSRSAKLRCIEKIPSTS